MTNLVITGGSGFVGSRLGKRFVSKKQSFSIIDKVVSPYFPEVTIEQNICDKDSLVLSCPKASAIIHLAAEHRDDVRPKSLYNEVNVEGTRNVCSMAEKQGINQIIFTSTVAVYGFAKVGTDESGAIDPFNDYGRTKYEAEQVLLEWQLREPEVRSLVIIRPTVIFGEQNRGNVYNLLKQIASGKFVMIGDGKNSKSMAYVENVAAFIEHSLGFGPSVHLYNYIDKPDVSMNKLVSTVYGMLGKSPKIGLRIPYLIGFAGGKLLDVAAWATGKQLPISSIRVKKFCSNTVFDTHIQDAGYTPEVDLIDGLERTVKHEFIENNQGNPLFYSE
jgi:GlcNAc-P-P-Und epimerase